MEVSNFFKYFFFFLDGGEDSRIFLKEGYAKWRLLVGHAGILFLFYFF